MSRSKYKTLFLDVGGVLLTNGWDHESRQEAAKHFDIDLSEINSRHSAAFDTFEIGHMTLDEYLNYLVFFQARSFTRQQFKDFMLAQSQPYLEMISLMMNLKERFRLRIVAISNEGRELAEYRIKTFKLDDLFDISIYSGFVGLRKPDPLIYRLAIDLSQTQPQNGIYIDDRPILAEAGRKIGFKTICHANVDATGSLLNELLN